MKTLITKAIESGLNHKEAGYETLYDFTFSNGVAIGFDLEAEDNREFDHSGDTPRNIYSGEVKFTLIKSSVIAFDQEGDEIELTDTDLELLAVELPKYGDIHMHEAQAEREATEVFYAMKNI